MHAMPAKQYYRSGRFGLCHEMCDLVIKVNKLGFSMKIRHFSDELVCRCTILATFTPEGNKNTRKLSAQLW